jgi:hypothetical protein
MVTMFLGLCVFILGCRQEVLLLYVFTKTTTVNLVLMPCAQLIFINLSEKEGASSFREERGAGYKDGKS